MDEAQPRRRRGDPTDAVLHQSLLRLLAEQRAEKTHLHPPETEKPGTEGASTPVLPQTPQTRIGPPYHGADEGSCTAAPSSKAVR